jgi:hypothetical protein
MGIWNITVNQRFMLECDQLKQDSRSS